MRPIPWRKLFTPGPYIRRLDSLWDAVAYAPRYRVDDAHREETARFESMDLDPVAGQALLDRVQGSLEDRASAPAESMASVHWLLFACIRLRSEIDRVLEIGTFDGETALLLSLLFERANITTLDLPLDDAIFAGTYNRDDAAEREAILARQAANTAEERIDLVLSNSFFLPAVVSGQFDLVWVDGGHRYPEIAWDICNAYHLTRPGGWMLVDDVMRHPRAHEDIDVGRDTFAVLQYLERRIPERIAYFLKRESAAASANPRKRKHVAVIRRVERPHAAEAPL